MEKITATILVFIGVFVFMLLLDVIWLKYIAGDFFFKEIGQIANPGGEGFEVNPYAGAFVYLLMTAAILIFVLPMANSWQHALVLGAVLGFISYGIFDGTNLAIFKGYTLKMVVVDVLWGTFIMGVGAVSGFLLQKTLS